MALANLWLFKPLVIWEGMKEPSQAGTYHTTTAETMISGGFKDNALPPSAKAVINFRILPGETVETVTERVKKVIDDPSVTVTVATNAGSRNPSPISPLDSEGYMTLKTTIEQNFPGVAVTPYQINAATDSGYYTVLTPNVYRFLAVEADASVLTMIHGLNERIAPEKYVKMVEFTAQFLQNIR
jgi:carboxypeptidase PM20D1